ncbi:MAG: hypothetical protein Q8Q07_09650 [Dehalococcoidales bacterium]|nr:hypothetical protein [Dehalococcoidales bacterium]
MWIFDLVVQALVTGAYGAIAPETPAIHSGGQEEPLISIIDESYLML